jgi:hypothetical protein
MRDFGKIITLTVKGNLFILLATFMREIGSEIKPMVLELTRASNLEEATPDNGRMIYSMEKDWSDGKMIPIMKVNFNLEKKVVWANKDGLMVQSILETGKTI